MTEDPEGDRPLLCADECGAALAAPRKTWGDRLRRDHLADEGSRQTEVPCASSHHLQWSRDMLTDCSKRKYGGNTLSISVFRAGFFVVSRLGQHISLQKAGIQEGYRFR
jgi:hypothetical protein